MILFVNEKNEIKDVNMTRDMSLTGYEIAATDNPFEGWSVDKICCYRVGLTPEKVTEVVGTEEVTYTDLEGNEVTTTRDVTETKETGKYLITMITPYIDSRIIEPIVWLRGQIKDNSSDILTTQDALCEISVALCDLSIMLTGE